MSEGERFEIQIRETRDLVRRMDRHIDLVDRLLAETETSVRTVHPEFTNSIGMELVWCQPGTFWMGSPEDEEGRVEVETLHEVTLTRGFWIGRHPVTQGQWEEVMGGNPSCYKESGPNAPVETVSWEDAQKFCRALSQGEGRDYRLPTEAEWEYACRAGSAGAWCFGGDEDQMGNYAWYRRNSSDRTNPVGRKRPNAWGIHDMHGNVWEWCQDWYEEYPTSSVIDPFQPEDGSFRSIRDGTSLHCRVRVLGNGTEHLALRVLRGGNWHGSADSCRSACRRRSDPLSRYDSLGFGFRVAVSSTP